MKENYHVQVDTLDHESEIKLIKVYLEMNSNFKLPFTQEGSDYLESLGIKDYVLAWKQLYDQIKQELKS
jgi:hypothetical protein